MKNKVPLVTFVFWLIKNHRRPPWVKRAATLGGARLVEELNPAIADQGSRFGRAHFAA